MGIVLKLLPYLASAIIIVLVYFYSYNAGYNKAQLECADSILSAELTAKTDEINRLKEQSKSADDTSRRLREALDRNRQQTQELVSKIDELSDMPLCIVNSDILDLIKKQRGNR